MATSKKPDPVVVDTPYLFRRGGQFHYRRRVPQWLQPIVESGTWWERLGPDEAEARRVASILGRQHDRMVTPEIRRLVQREGGPAKVDAALGMLGLYRAVAADDPRWPGDVLTELMGIPEVTKADTAAILRAHEAQTAHAQQRLVALAPIVAAMDPDTDPPALTVSQAGTQWLESTRPASAIRYRMVLRRFRETMGDPPLAKVDRQMMWAFRDQIAQMPALAKLPSAVRTAPVSVQLQWRQAHPDHPTILPGATVNHLSVMRALFTWCRKRDLITSNPAIDIDAPDDPRGADAHNHAAMLYSEVPAFMTALAAHSHPVANALRFTILTGARTGEVRGATWKEIDTANRVWTIPATRMKARRAHAVPLSQAALDILESLPRNGDRVFSHLSKDSMRDFLHRHTGRRDVVVHGFRSSFADWAAEETTHDRSVVEMALAHTVGDRVERAYRRGDMRTKRFALMEDWARFCAGAPR